MKKGFALPLILVIVAISVIALGISYFLYKSKPSSQPQLTTISQSISTPTPATKSTPTPDETENWKTYQDPTFSVKYPQKFNNQELQISFKKVEKEPNEKLSAFIGNYLISRGAEPYGKTFMFPALRMETVNGKESIWYEGNLDPSEKYIEVYIQENNTNIVIMKIYDGQNQTSPISDAQRKLLEQILSSFKFTN